VEGLRATLMQTLPFAALLVVLAVVLGKRGQTRQDLRLVWPPLATTTAWLGAFVVYATLMELVNRQLGMHEVEPWAGRYAPLVIVIRVIGIVFLAPIAEELAFRGLLLPRLARTRLGGAGAVVVTAAIFAALHFAAPAAMLLIFLDGVFYGVARLRADSLLLPMLMHMLGNTYAAAERLVG
jgi:membrane protease YdiL (CAAX protease family)